MPGREHRREPQWRAMLSRLSENANGAEEYWVILRRPGRHGMVERGKRLLRNILPRPGLETTAQAPRLCFLADNVPEAAGVSENLPWSARGEKLELALLPHFSAPKNISVFAETTGALAALASDHAAEAGHVIHGRRPAAQVSSYLERLLLYLREATKRSWQPAGALRVLPGGKVQMVLRAGETGSALLKLPLIPYAATRMRENAEHLLRLSRAGELSPEQRRIFPANLAEGLCEGQAYYLETFLPGRSLDQWPATARGPQQFRAIWERWFEIQQSLARSVVIAEPVFAAMLGDHARRLQEWLMPAGAQAARLQRVIAYCREKFLSRELSLSLVHGDFSIKNILADPATQALTGVVDWDLADFFSAPPLDVLHFFVRLDERSFRDPAPAIALRLIQDRRGRHARYFEEACARFGYRQEDWPALVMWYWLFRQRGYIGSDKNSDTKFVQRQFSDLLDLFEREVLPLRAGAVA